MDFAKLARRVSVLERSTLELLTNVDRLAGRVEQLTDAIRSAPPAAVKRPATPKQTAIPVPPPAAPPSEPVELGPWSDPNVALPATHRAVHPEPFFARLAAQRAKDRRVENGRPEAMPAAAARTPEPKAAATTGTAKKVIATRGPVAKPSAPAAPRSEPAPLPQRVVEAARVREVVLKLAREGWDAPRIAREGRIPVRDVYLILKSAGRETGTADFATPRR